MKKLFKEHKAITLIALVVTIVVLIILAGVLVSITLGNNSLFNKAKLGKELYANAQDYEDTQIAKTANEIDSYVGSVRTTLSNIDYTTGEQDTGLKWIDGKKIYQKTILLGDETSANSGITKALNIANIDKSWVVQAYGYYNNSATPTFMSMPAEQTNVYTTADSIIMHSAGNGYKITGVVATIQYTKTED